MKQFLNIEQVAKILGKPISTIETETSKRPGNLPPFAKIGGAIRFDPDLIQPWFDSKIVNPIAKNADAVSPVKAGRPVKAA